MTERLVNMLGSPIPIDECVAAAATGAILFHMPGTESFVLESEQARRWCNGMFTNNIRKLAAGEGNRSAICSDRGRVQGLIDTYCLDDSRFLCVLDGIDISWFQERFRMFMVLDDVEMVEEAEGILTLQGTEAANLLSAAGFHVPERQHCHSGALQVVRRDRSGHGGYDLLGPVAELERAGRRLLENGAGQGSEESLDCLRILSGRARWPQDGTEKSLIHELALDKECCAFDKGCYVGQEIINRIDVKGLVNKKLTRLSLNGPVETPAGLFTEEKEIGILTSIIGYRDGYIGLATLRKAVWAEGTVLYLHGSSIPIGKVG